jgi:hypothetical protein
LDDWAEAAMTLPRIPVTAMNAQWCNFMGW